MHLSLISTVFASFVLAFCDSFADFFVMNFSVPSRIAFVPADSFGFVAEGR